MAVTNTFREAVTSGEVLKVRIMMKNSLLLDLTFTEFNDMEKVASKLEGLYDKHDGCIFNPNKETWDDAYMKKLMVEILDNFSHERIEHLKEVVRYLRPVPKNDIRTHSSDKKNNINNHSKKEKKLSYKEQKRRDKEAGNYRRAKMAAGAVTGAAAGVAVMSITKAIVGITASTAVATIVGGAVIGMVAGSAIEKIKA